MRRLRQLSFLTGLVVPGLLGLAGCGGSPSHPAEGPWASASLSVYAASASPAFPPQRVSGPVPLDPGGGVVKGRVAVKVTEEIKKVLALDNLANLQAANLPAKDAAVCCMGDMSQQTWKIDPEQGGVANVVVWLSPPKGQFFAVNPAKAGVPEQVEIDQPHCAFGPHVAWVMPAYKDRDGKAQKSQQKVVVKNSAPMTHTVKWGDETGQGNNVLLAPGKEWELDLKPSKSVITQKCAIHPWMSGYLWAFDHPYASITGKDGAYEIRRVPTGGKLNLVVWHEAAGYLTPATGEELEVKDGEPTVKDFEVPADKVKP
jgi:hypothetical protein